MNIQETLALIEALRSAGATHFKSAEVELTLSGSSVSLPVKTMADIAPPHTSPVQENTEATAKLKELISTLSLSDEEILNRVAPAGAGG